MTDTETPDLPPVEIIDEFAQRIQAVVERATAELQERNDRLAHENVTQARRIVELEGQLRHFEGELSAARRRLKFGLA